MPGVNVTSCTASPLPPLSILIVHEQHLQAMGCDSRLLGIIRALVAARMKVSLFFRGHTREAARSPPSAELATLLQIPRGHPPSGFPSMCTVRFYQQPQKPLNK